MPIYTIAAAVEIELEIRKSRFIGLILPVDNRNAAQHELERLRALHRGATHRISLRRSAPATLDAASS